MDSLRNLTEKDMEDSIEILPMPQDSNSYKGDIDSQTIPTTVWTGDTHILSTSTELQDDNVSQTQPKTVCTEDTQRLPTPTKTQDDNVSETETTTEMNGENQNIMNISNDLNQPSLHSRNEMGIEQLKADVKDLNKKFVKVIAVLITVFITVVGALVFQTHQATREMNNRMDIQDKRLLNIKSEPTVENDDKTGKSFRSYVNYEMYQQIRNTEKEHKAMKEDFISLQMINKERYTPPYIHEHVAIVIINVLISLIIYLICLRTSSRKTTSMTGRLESCLKQVTGVDESRKTNISNVKANVSALEEEIQGMTETVELNVSEAIEENRTSIRDLQQHLNESKTQTTENIQRVELNANNAVEEQGRQLQVGIDDVRNDLNTTNGGLLTLTTFREYQMKSSFHVQLKRKKGLEVGRNKFDDFDKHFEKCGHFNEDDFTYTTPVAGSYLLGGTIYQKGDGVLNLYVAWGKGLWSLLVKTDQDNKFHNGSVVRKLDKGDKVRLELERLSGEATVHSCVMYGHLIGYKF